MTMTDAFQKYSSRESCIGHVAWAIELGNRTPSSSAALSHGMQSRLTPRRRRASRTLARIGHFSLCPPQRG